MRNNIYISTSVFKERNLEHILMFCLKNDLINLELGSNVDFAEKVGEILLKFKKEGMSFLIHNYFPRPKEDFVLNLGSADAGILTKSMGHCKMAIDLSAELGAPFYSVHAGFMFHASPSDLGKPQTHLQRIPYEVAYNNFLKSIIELAEYAAKRNVKLAIENNVVAKFNLVKGRNEVCLLAEAAEMEGFYGDASSNNLYYLIDLGHLKVTSLSLGFDKVDYLAQLAPYTIAYHVSDNNGETDSHLPFDERSWFIDLIKCNTDKICVLEAQNLKPEGIENLCEVIGNG